MLLKEFHPFLFHKNFNYLKATSFLEKNKSLEELLYFFKENNFPREKEEEVERINKIIEKENIRVIFYGKEGYPEPLKNIKNPPIALFIKGKIPKGFYFSIVGSRKPLPESVEIAKHFTRELVFRNIIIVSGLARGIDGTAHRETLQNGGKTIAVLGSGHLKIYPPEHRALAKEIEKNGALLSEFPPFTPPNPRNFPQRNRIIAGLSRGVLLIEAGLKSGSLKTANFALEEGRELFVIPGNAFEIKYAGSNYLIKKGAKLVQTVEDILEEFPDENFEKIGKKEEKLDLTQEELEVLNYFPSGKKIHFEELLKNFKLEKLSVVLTSLELKGTIEKLPGNFFIKKIKN